MNLFCPKCNEQQWSLMDKRYVELYGHCWSCDNKKFYLKELSLEEFEKREKEAVKS